MRRLVVSIGIVCAALVAAVVVAATSGAQGGPPAGTLELVSRDSETSFKFVDNAPRRKESAGDMAILRAPVRTPAGERAGRFQVYFVAVKGGDFERRFLGQASGSFVLSGGDITVNGVIDDRRDNDMLAIAGGTGAYAGARGTLLVTETNDSTRFTFTFQP
jgi:hypothetical protein